MTIAPGSFLRSKAVPIGAVLALGAVLAGCGGSSTTPLGFILTPSGGLIKPASNLFITAPAGAVTVGVRVDATPAPPPAPTDPAPTPPVSLPAVLSTAEVTSTAVQFKAVTVNGAPITFNHPVVLSFTSVDIPLNGIPANNQSIYEIFTYDNGSWQPVTVVANPSIHDPTNNNAVVANVISGSIDHISSSGWYAVFLVTTPGPHDR